MISVTMAYYNRSELLERTLWAYYHLHKDVMSKNDYEFVIVDDGSREDLKAEIAAEKLKNKLNIEVLYIKRDKVAPNPSIPINISVKHSSGDIVIITNPEVMPLTPVLAWVQENQTANNWNVCKTYSLSQEQQDFISYLQKEHIDFIKNVREEVVLKDEGVEFIPGEGWYDHPYFRVKFYYFLASICKNDFIRIGGIDEDFANGIAYEDDDLVRRLNQNGFELNYMDRQTALHQFHDSTGGQPGPEWMKNYELYYKNLHEKKLVANVDKEWGVIP